MKRRSLLKTSLLGLGAALAPKPRAQADVPNMKITRVRFYHVATSRPTFNQSPRRS